jgi:hypothetical protein
MRSNPPDLEVSDMQHATDTMPTTTTAHHVLAATITSAMTVGAIFVLGRAVDSATQHAVLVLAVVGSSTLALWFGLGAERTLRLWAIGGIFATMGVALAVGGLRAQPTEVNEQVVMVGDVQPAGVMEKNADVMEKPAGNVLVASGEFEALEHAGEGTASIIRTADGTNVLTLTGFSTDAGPDLDVRLVAGNPGSDADVESGRSIRLGKLKGTSGDQQYVIPADVDPSEFTHAYIWCRAFSVGFTRATLA